MSDCSRHGLPWFRAEPPDLWYVTRCVHVGARFVVETRCDAFGSTLVDFVEELPDGRLLIEDGHSAEWDAFTGRLLADDHPCPETGAAA